MKKVMLITGGSRGIGAATVVKASQLGYTVCLTYHQSSATANKLVRNIEKSGQDAIALPLDVASEESVVSVFEKVDAEFGQLDVLVNNAGIIAHESQLINMSVKRMKQIFDTNILGSFICAREAAKRMSTSYGGKGGSIVNISSIASRLGSSNEFIDYAASKGAVDTLTIGLAKELATEGVRVNSVSPGLINTELHADAGDANRPFRLKNNIPMQRVGEPEEVAEAILWLASDAASYTTGAILDVSGGR